MHKDFEDSLWEDGLSYVPIGTKIYFKGEKRPYTVRARSRRFLVCTKPFNPQKTVLYTIIDRDHKVRGTENLIFGMGAETDQDCADMIDRLEGIWRFQDPAGKLPWFDPTCISSRNNVLLEIEKVVLPKWTETPSNL